ncbi:hypothetical protein [Sinisalibacter aestuarii]|uniref:Uncharacterized protein n=1 Tax=Sinisalibacter aestuarii TaxID=2949426 RepID=A0ABQ5LTR0_9RHOB|nr:hypothetical protein [Sinisalibacter aestuarii]GKY88382.1 hypothetical protein STA1M1_22510 [Sinisalibacter aestuarii]
MTSPGPCPHGATRQRILAESGFDRDEIALLGIMRHFFQSFTLPQTQGWAHGLDLAHAAFPPEHAPNLWVCALAVVQTMRGARMSGFEFSNPDCPSCARGVSDHERQLMEVISCTRRGQRSRAHTAALLLCEGNDPAGLIGAAGHLARQLACALNAPALHGGKVSSP